MAAGASWLRGFASNAGNYTVTLTGTSGLVGTFTPGVLVSAFI